MSDNLLSQEEIDALLRGGPVQPPAPESSELATPAAAPMPQKVNVADNELDRFYKVIVESCKTVLDAALNRDVSFSTNKHKKNSLDQFMAENQGKVDYAIDITFKEGITGKFFILFEKQFGLFIGDLMVGNDGSELPKKLNEMYESAIIEAANQIMGNACNNLNLLFGTNVDFDSPILTEIVYDNGIDIDVGEQSYCFPVTGSISGLDTVEMKFVIPEALAQDILFILKGVEAVPEHTPMASGPELSSASAPELDSFSKAPSESDIPMVDGPISFEQSGFTPEPVEPGPMSGFQQPVQQTMPGMNQMGGMQGVNQMGGMQGMNQMNGMQGVNQMGGMQGMNQMNGMQGMNQMNGMPGMNQMGGMQGMNQMGNMQGMNQMGNMQGMNQMGNMQGMNQMGNMQGMNQMGGMQGMNQMGGMQGMNQMNSMNQDQNIQQARFGQLETPAGLNGPSNLDILLDVPLQITVELGRTTKTVKEILEIGAGSVVELNKLAGESVELLVNNRLIAKGEVVVIDENFGVRITSIVSPQERLESLK